MTDFEDYRRAAAVLFGEAGARCYDHMADICERGFEGKISPARPLVIVDSHAMAPYNRAAGWYHFVTGQVVILRRHIDEAAEFNVLAHELAHAYQREVLGDMTTGSRGSHRRPSWYQALSVASPRLFGIDFPEDEWPGYKSQREGKRVLKVQKATPFTEVDATHWPGHFIKKCSSRNVVQELLFYRVQQHDEHRLAEPNKHHEQGRGTEMGFANTQFRLREYRRGRETIVANLDGTHRYTSTDNPIDTTAAFTARATPITVSLSVTREAGSNGLLFDFGGSTTGMAAWLDGEDIGFAAGAATGSAGTSVVLPAALANASRVYNLVFAVIPGLGLLRVWADGELIGRGRSDAMAAWAGTSDGAIGDAGAGGTTARVPGAQAVTLANATIVGPVRLYDKQRPRSIEFVKNSFVIPQASLALTTVAPSAVVA